MTRAEEYRLSQYQELGRLTEKKEIYLVRDRMTGRMAVKKRVSAELLEIYLHLREMKNPYIPQIYECMQEGEELILLEEYLTGKNLEEMMLEGHKFSVKEAAELIVNLCKALEPLHNSQPPFICRDLKPENVMITAEGACKLVDFNIARRYQAGKHCDTTMMGTEGFAAPEQFGFSQTDARTDIYALGVLFNYLLLQKIPVEQVAEGAAGKIIQRCTAIDPKNRYQNTNELQNAMKAAGILGGNYNVNSIKMEKKKNRHERNKNTWKMPGFRSGKLWISILSVVLYLSLTKICFSIKFQEGGQDLYGLKLWINQFCFWAAQISSILLLGDFRGIREKYPLLNSENLLVRLLADVSAYFIIFLLAVICASVSESWIFWFFQKISF